MLYLISLGELASGLAGLKDSESRVIFRMLVNTVVWGLIGTVAVVMMSV